ncbi:hypothetical protein [Dawidia soli]|uniref:Uncharacterized protein n=1 Tax=Dawidia soli TaxID=2782352 RepID=A0AAP2DDP4_9BACT|nr:hypothetical protein [Dawidia soli]MBT1689784.1 hypothetical protein [Dawidia soli]
MKHSIILFLAGALLLPLGGYAQTTLQRSFPVQAGQTIALEFDHPRLIKVSTWDKNDVAIQGTVSINHGEHDDAFVLEPKTNGKILTIRNEIRDLNKLPRIYTIVQGGQTMTFQTRDAMRKYQAEHPGGFERMSEGVDIEIVLEIKVPRGIPTQITSVYGMVEVRSFQGPISVASTYGGVDAAVAEKTTGQIKAETNYGEIFSNLDTRLTGNPNDPEDFHLLVAGNAGTGPNCSFQSRYGNVYLRKAN